MKNLRVHDVDNVTNTLFCLPVAELQHHDHPVSVFRPVDQLDVHHSLRHLGTGTSMKEEKGGDLLHVLLRCETL